MSRAAFVLAALILATGCNLYFGGDDDDCEWGGAAFEPGTYLLRDPYSGQCVDLGGGGGCGDPCNPCPDLSADRADAPTWGACDNYCTGLDEASCLVTTGCRGAYIESCIDETSGLCDYTQARGFYQCWAVDQTGPIQGPCEGLDAWTCSQHDDCVAIHDDTCDYVAGDGGGEAPGAPISCLGGFLLCAPENAGRQPECDSDTDGDCSDGTHCNHLEVCLPPPSGGGGGGGNGDQEVPVQCWGYCVPDDTIRGTCYDLAACAIPPPACPEGELPGVANGCWSGYCIPVAECETPPPCDGLDEGLCVARADCEAYYQGIDCTCDASGNCTCNQWVYTSCMDAVAVDPPPPGACRCPLPVPLALPLRSFPDSHAANPAPEPASSQKTEVSAPGDPRDFNRLENIHPWLAPC